MRTPTITLDEGDRRAMARGAAAGLGVTTLLALRADWVLASGVLAFRRTGQNVAAYVMGLDLLPWALLFTAALAGATVLALGWTGAAASKRGGAIPTGPAGSRLNFSAASGAAR